MHWGLSRWTVVTPFGEFRFGRGASTRPAPDGFERIVFFARRRIECLDPVAVRGALELCDRHARPSSHGDGFDRSHARELARDFEWRALTGQLTVEEVQRPVVVLRGEPVERARGPAPAAAPPPVREPPPPRAPEKTWIEFLLLDRKGNPVAGQPCRVKLADGSTQEARTDERGLARLHGIDPGDCELSFTRLAPDAWERA